MPLLTLPRLLAASVLLRTGMLFYGLYQDAHSALKYTDIDYYVFTDAARLSALGHSPYERATYRYTPLLAWMLAPTARAPQWLWFSFGKALFAAADVLAGAIIVRLLVRYQRMEQQGALVWTAATWLLNPMVATISTRGSSEGLLGVMVALLLWAALARRPVLAGALLGLATHFKVYPVIYGPAILLHFVPAATGDSLPALTKAALSPHGAPLRFTMTAAGAFCVLNAGMYALYGSEFITHTFTHHISRLDHRHNFSVWNTLLHTDASSSSSSSSWTTLAFLPQLLLACLLLPLRLARSSLAPCLFLQTFAFVAFNKVVTSQYFMWYLFLLPFILPGSELVTAGAGAGAGPSHKSRMRRGRRVVGGFMLLGWVGAQAAWLAQAYRLEFLGESSFVPGLWAAGVAFFVVNVWVLGEFVVDVRQRAAAAEEDVGGKVEEKVR